MTNGVWGKELQEMKLLRVKATGFRNCEDDFCIDLIAKAKKTSEDKEYELMEIDEGLFVYSTMAIIGKNASGKTSTLELLDWCYDILSKFQLTDKEVSYTGISLEIIFYEAGEIYKYNTRLDDSLVMEDRATFYNQELKHKKYYKSKVNQIYEDNWETVENIGVLPEDLSIVFFVLKNSKIREICYDSFAEREEIYNTAFKYVKFFKMEDYLLEGIIRIFDSNIDSLRQLDDNHFELIYQGKVMKMADNELFLFLSSGTTKGIALYILAIASMQNGFDLLIDEIEKHFHKTLVENLICLYKDKKVNKSNATLIFTTHYCELLDMFNRSDNIWITHSREKVIIENMYEKYDFRSELLKSKKFYQNAFGTAVNYEALMDLKRMLI